MTRFRPQWLGDWDHHPAAPRARVLPPRPPTFGLRARRGRWLEPDSLEGTGPRPAPVRRGRFLEDTSRTRVHPTPKWPGTMHGLAAIALSILAFSALLGNTNVGRALIVVPVLAYIAYQLAQRLAEADGQPAIVPILMGGLSAKFVGICIRYYVVSKVYGASDAVGYVEWGRRIAGPLRHGELIDIGRLRGTNTIRLITGIVFTVTPASPMVGFLVFGFFSYIGMILFWRAYRRVFGDRWDLRYLQVLVLMPSLVFWPSALGKEAWMVMCVGLISYGVANILTNRTLVGWGAFVAGTYGVLAVRPHVGIAIFAGLVLAELLRSRGSQGAGRAGLSIVLLFFIGGAVMSSAAAFLGISNWSKATVEQELNDTSDRTSEGRSQFTPTPVNSPAQFPQGAFTVLFRPMPHEVQSPQEFVSALENVGLLALIVFTAPRLGRFLMRSRRHPYFIFCLGTLIVFVVEYSSFSNFALIARQRTQVTALLLAVLFMPRDDPGEIERPPLRPSRASRSATR
jgi:hypothetical protein